MSKIEEYKDELIRIQEMSILDTVDLVERANGCDKESKVGRRRSDFGCTNQPIRHLL